MPTPFDPPKYSQNGPGAQNPFVTPPQSATGSRGAGATGFAPPAGSPFGAGAPTGGAYDVAGAAGSAKFAGGAPVAGTSGVRNLVSQTGADKLARQNYANTPQPTNPANNLLAPGAPEQFYGKTEQDYLDPSRTERLVDQGMGGGLNDYYEFANNRLNDQFASMGGGPSGALLRAGQQLRANQAHEMMGYAKNADEIHYGRIGAGQHAAGESEEARNARLALAMNSALGLASGEGGNVQGFYNTAATTSNPFTQEGINTDVQSSTINPAVNAYKDSIKALETYYTWGQNKKE